VDIYDPLKNSWSSGKEMPQARTGTQSVVIKDKIYVIGGAAGGTPTNSIDVYEPAAGTWNKAASMKSARTGHCASSVGDRIYIIGGATEMSAAGIIDSVEMLAIK
jgi:N-acetylneuraminic acid mutarotase